MSYSNGKIYKIISKLTDKIYIGSTRQTLEDRLRSHNKDYTAYLKSNIGRTTAIELLKYGDYEIELIELYPCESKTELERREGEIQLENRNIIVNKNIAGRTSEEYYAEHKDRIAERNARYSIDNKVDRSEYFAQWRIDNKNWIIERDAQYYSDNKGKFAKYRLDNKEKTAAPFKCECGSVVRHDGTSPHLKTKKHILFISV
jgi:hypothetical protein